MKRLGIYGLQYIINVRDYSALAAKDFEIIDFEIQFDYARAQKSEEELASVRHSMDINKQGVLDVLRAYEPARRRRNSWASPRTPLPRPAAPATPWT